MPIRTDAWREKRKLYLRKLRKKQGLHKPRETLTTPPEKPDPHLRSSNRRLYMKLYARWYRYHGYHLRKPKT